MNDRSADRSSGRALLVADHPTLRQAMRQALEAFGVGITAEAPPGREAVLAAWAVRPHVAVVDVATGGERALDTCRRLRAESPNTRVIALAPRYGPAHHAAVATGAIVVTTDVSVADLAAAVARATQAKGRRDSAPACDGRRADRVLTTRECEVLSLAAQGMTDGQISRVLYISHKTVKNHLHHVYTKLGASSRTDAVVLGMRHGLIPA
jgi:DNA-binding NarL/FixJ family response regulator